MEIPVTAGPWLVLGLTLGLLVAALGTLAVTAVRRRPGSDTAAAAAPPSADPVVDDLPGFLEFPPGSLPAPPAADTGWPPLAPPPAPPPAATAPAGREGAGTTGVLVAMGATAALLIGAAAAVATTRTSDTGGGPAPDARPESSGTSADPAPGPVSAELAFESVVLERHAVGVTVAVPRVLVTSRDGRVTAEVELATFNCLRDAAPQDPASAGCSRSVTEYAELATPELDVRTDGDTVRLAGSFATSRRPTGSPPVATGRVYDLAVTTAPRDGRADSSREAATGWLELGSERVGIREDGTSTLTFGD